MSEEFSILPIAMKVAAKTIAMDLVSVSPLGTVNEKEMDRIKREVASENRERKINSLTEDSEYEEMKISDHPDYLTKGPKGELFYLDFKYKDEEEDDDSDF